MAGLTRPLGPFLVLEQRGEGVAIPEETGVHVRPGVVAGSVGGPVPLPVLLRPRVVIDREDPGPGDVLAVGLSYLDGHLAAHDLEEATANIKRPFPNGRLVSMWEPGETVP